MRKQIHMPGVKDGYQTKFNVPVTALEHLRGIIRSRQISRWLADAIRMLQDMEADDRNGLLLQDSQTSHVEKEAINVRLSLETQGSLKEIMVHFRMAFPSVDLEMAGIVRAAIFLRLRQDLGWLSGGLTKKC